MKAGRIGRPSALSLAGATQRTDFPPSHSPPQKNTENISQFAYVFSGASLPSPLSLCVLSSSQCTSHTCPDCGLITKPAMRRVLPQPPPPLLPLLLLLALPLTSTLVLFGPARAVARAAPRAVRASSAQLAASDFGLEFAFDEDEDEEFEDEDEDAEKEMRAPSRKNQDAADALMLSDTPAANMTVGELQEQLRVLGQKAGGKKSELIERVQLMQRKRALGLPIHDMQVQREDDMKWYLIQTANGFERAVERTINMAINAQKLHKKIDKVRCATRHREHPAPCACASRCAALSARAHASRCPPCAQVWVPILEGETSVRESSVMPSYIFIHMRMDENLHFLISDMQYVINFVGADRGGRSMTGQMVGNRGFVRPMPIDDAKYEQIKRLTLQAHPGEQDAGADGDGGISYELDDMVEVTEGPFKGMSGPVVGLDENDAAAELTVALSVMGRDTPVQLPREHVEKCAY